MHPRGRHRLAEHAQHRGLRRAQSPDRLESRGGLHRGRNTQLGHGVAVRQEMLDGMDDHDLLKVCARCRLSQIGRFRASVHGALASGRESVA